MNAMALDPRLLAVLACPEDKGPLYYLGDSRWPLQPEAASPIHRFETASR